MAKSKQRAVSLLVLLGGILVVMATRNLPENPSPQRNEKPSRFTIFGAVFA